LKMSAAMDTVQHEPKLEPWLQASESKSSLYVYATSYTTPRISDLCKGTAKTNQAGAV
jgi:hypothetical protein